MISSVYRDSLTIYRILYLRFLQWTFYDAIIIVNLNSASVEFAEDARRQGRRRTMILQVLANTADSVKSALLKGKLFSKITIFMAASN